MNLGVDTPKMKFAKIRPQKLHHTVALTYGSHHHKQKRAQILDQTTHGMHFFKSKNTMFNNFLDFGQAPQNQTFEAKCANSDKTHIRRLD